MVKEVKCESVITLPQFEDTCWFNSLLMALLYSDGTRQYLKNNLHKSEFEAKNKELYGIFMDILENRYFNDKDENLVFFNELKPEKILKMLHIADKEVFYFNLDKHPDGHLAEYYFIRLFEYFGLKEKVVYLNKKGNEYFYSPFNNPPIIEYKPIISNGNGNNTTDKQTLHVLFERDVEEVPEFPDLIVVSNTLKEYDPSVVMTLNSEEIQETIDYKGNLYKISSTLTSNWNDNLCHRGHQIAGVTCNNKRYMYNGWLKTYFNDKGRVPCGLMEYDWLKKTKNFCLANDKCELIEIDVNVDPKVNTDVCFNTLDVGNNTYIYVRVDDDDDKIVMNVLWKKIRQTYQDCAKQINILENGIKVFIRSNRVYKKGKDDIKKKEYKTNLALLKRQLHDKQESCAREMIQTEIIYMKAKDKIRKKEEILKNVDQEGGSGKKKLVTGKKNLATVKKNSVTGKKNLETGKKTTMVKLIFNKDNKDLVLNKQTNRWVTSTGAIGRKIIKNN
jgi:hypothetical protein